MLSFRISFLQSIFDDYKKTCSLNHFLYRWGIKIKQPSKFTLWTLKPADGKPARGFRSSCSSARMFSKAPNQQKRIKVIQRDAKLYHFIPYVFIFYSIHLSSLWLLLAKEIDSDLKAKKEFMRSVGWEKLPGMEGRLQSYAWNREERGRSAGSENIEPKPPVLLLTWVDPDGDFGTCSDSASCFHSRESASGWRSLPLCSPTYPQE